MARTCKFSNCDKYAVRQGVCVSHGAKVKHARCTATGCGKFAVRAGKCVSHGAKKPTCKAEGCTKQAQQKGVCVAHGAKKAQCKTEECTRQAVRGGMCKTHASSIPADRYVKCKAPRCSKHANKGTPYCSAHQQYDEDEEETKQQQDTVGASRPSTARSSQSSDDRSTASSREDVSLQSMGSPATSHTSVPNTLPSVSDDVVRRPRLCAVQDCENDLALRSTSPFCWFHMAKEYPTPPRARTYRSGYYSYQTFPHHEQPSHEYFSISSARHNAALSKSYRYQERKYEWGSEKPYHVGYQQAEPSPPPYWSSGASSYQGVDDDRSDSLEEGVEGYKACSAPGCGRYAKQHGRCIFHFRIFQQHYQRSQPTQRDHQGWREYHHSSHLTRDFYTQMPNQQHSVSRGEAKPRAAPSSWHRPT